MPLYQSEITIERLTSANTARTTVASSASSVTVLPANADRLGATIFNRSTKKLYLNLDAAATVSQFTVLLVANAYYELPYDYTGDVFGIWEAVNGDAQVTEFSA